MVTTRVLHSRFLSTEAGHPHRSEVAVFSFRRGASSCLCHIAGDNHGDKPHRRWLSLAATSLVPSGHGQARHTVPPSHKAPQPTVHCTYPGTELPPTCVTFGLSADHGFRSAQEAHDWFLRMMTEYEGFAVETDQPGEAAMPFVSETVRRVVVG